MMSWEHCFINYGTFDTFLQRHYWRWHVKFSTSWKKNWRGISIRNSQHTIHEISRYITRRYTKPIGCIALRDSIFGQFEESTGLCVTRYRGEEVNAPGLSRITPMMYHPSPQWNLVELVFQKVWDSRGP